MAKAQMYCLDKSVHDGHTHSYQKVTQLGVDAVKTYASPQRIATSDDAEVNVSDATDLEAVGVTLGATETAVPT